MSSSAHLGGLIRGLGEGVGNIDSEGVSRPLAPTGLLPAPLTDKPEVRENTPLIKHTLHWILIALGIIIGATLIFLPLRTAGQADLSFPDSEERELSPREWVMWFALYYENSQELVDEIVSCESGYDPSVDNPDSTASGLWQFLDGTWEYTQDMSGLYGDVYDARLNAQLGNYLLSKEGKRHWKECLQKK